MTLQDAGVRSCKDISQIPGYRPQKLLAIKVKPLLVDGESLAYLGSAPLSIMMNSPSGSRLDEVFTKICISLRRSYKVLRETLPQGGGLSMSFLVSLLRAGGPSEVDSFGCCNLPGAAIFFQPCQQNQPHLVRQRCLPCPGSCAVVRLCRTLTLSPSTNPAGALLLRYFDGLAGAKDVSLLCYDNCYSTGQSLSVFKASRFFLVADQAGVVRPSNYMVSELSDANHMGLNLHYLVLYFI
ncbi:hypothetical protein HPP92_017023 [Vanilla planifolia]|uniref:Uncharacterized protein n=1 Tax=Vanilla planifolia TaxID=51239 RepID=A0A835USM3_VANPL|nr:hypothetical protein HPP92_017023 [Vanilla planifolia]